jgi:hypothetical protein
LPTRKEAIALGALALISWQLPIQSFLLEQRVLVQAVYRQTTNQVPIAKQPPVLLVEIDEESVKQAKISDPKPLDRSYIADLINKLSAMNAKVIGIDYLLDRYQQENDQKLAAAIRAAVQKQGTWFVFDAPFRRSSLGFLLALAYRLNINQSVQPPSPQLQSSINLLSQVKTYVRNTTNKDYKDIFSSAGRVQPLTQFSYQLKQMWLQPILDFSIPPEQVYQSIPAWKLLETSSTFLQQQQQPVVLIAPGQYGEAGISGRGEDNFPLPPAVKYWRTLKNPSDLSRWYPSDLSRWFPGGGAHAYMIHHFLNQRIVTPIPDLWLVLIAALLGKGIVVSLEKDNEEKTKKEKRVLALLSNTQGKCLLLLTSGTVIYGLVSLQLYISAAVVLPVVLPTATLWSFVLLTFLQKKSHI